MIRILLTSADERRELPEGVVLTSEHTGHRMVWLRTYARPHPDPVSGLWTLPHNLFAEWQVAEIEAKLPTSTSASCCRGTNRG
ncbi:MAG: hypothetical protein M3O28_00125 [Actinomycetota bacterium]|nr:hypothetical protein [Actinomycetota bacterium]